MEIEKLKPVVNQPQVWQPLLEYFEDVEHGILMQMKFAEEEHRMRQLQGQLQLLDTLKRMRDSVNSNSRGE